MEVEVSCLRKKMGRGRKEPSPSPSIGHQAKNLHPLFKRRTWILGGVFLLFLGKTISIES
jgi:hypothetical protein